MNTSSFQDSIRNYDITWLQQEKKVQEKPKIADRTYVGIPGHERILWNSGYHQKSMSSLEQKKAYRQF